jgi:hypothetical protein
VHHHFVSGIPDVLESVVKPPGIGNFTSNLFERQGKQMMPGMFRKEYFRTGYSTSTLTAGKCSVYIKPIYLVCF